MKAIATRSTMGLLSEPAAYVEGANLYEYVGSNPTSYVDPLGLQSATTRPTPPTTQQVEQALWNTQKGAAVNALKFWRDFLNLRQGNGPVSDECMANMLKMLRAMSWVESRHGTAGQNRPGRDPIQSGNPRDDWWRSIEGKDDKDRVIGGPGKGNWWLHELPGAIGRPAPVGGHDNPAFTPSDSYLWGALALIQKMNNNGNSDDRTYKCGDCSDERLFNGALDYNGGGDPTYGDKLRDALRLIG